MAGDDDAAATPADLEFPCALTLDIPFPTPRLATVAHGALSVDKELSSLVRRTFSTVSSSASASPSEENVLRVVYEARTNRMLRVAVNSFMDTLRLVIEVMEQLDVDVLEPEAEAEKAG